MSKLLKLYGGRLTISIPYTVFCVSWSAFFEQGVERAEMPQSTLTQINNIISSMTESMKPERRKKSLTAFPQVYHGKEKKKEACFCPFLLLFFLLVSELSLWKLPLSYHQSVGTGALHREDSMKGI